MPLTYRNTRTGRTVKVPTPDEAASDSPAPKRMRRIQEKRISALDSATRWERVEAPAPRAAAPAPRAEPPAQPRQSAASGGPATQAVETPAEISAPTSDEPDAAPEPSLADVRAWAREQGIEVSTRGRLSEEVIDAYKAAHTGSGE
jgi:hypothetical protein